MASGDPVSELVREGWSQLQRQNPLAAWASWQQALRLRPEDPAATQALERLAHASELPEAARRAYVLKPPATAAARERFGELVQERRAETLDDLAEVYAELADEIGDEDGSAAYDEGLCLAWLGRNAEAIDALGRSLPALAANDRESAVAAWMLAGVLRQGAGAEDLADLYNARLSVPRLDLAEADPLETIASTGRLRSIEAPADPISGQSVLRGAQVYEWLDRPMPSADRIRSGRDLPRVLGTVILTEDSLHFSRPGDLKFGATEERFLDELGLLEPFLGGETHARLEYRPLSFPLIDSPVFAFRLPDELDRDRSAELSREAVELYFESTWLHTTFASLAELGDPEERRTPLDAAVAGDLERIQLEALIRLQEEFAERPSMRAMYHGYPFDRLRRRLGLSPSEPGTVDEMDVSCMSRTDLARLDPQTLDPASLLEAMRSANGLGELKLGATFAHALVTRHPERLAGADGLELLKTLVREAMERGDGAQAQDWIDRAVAAAGPDRGRFLEAIAQLRQRIEAAS